MAAAGPPTALRETKGDPSTYANYHEIVSRRIVFDWNVDFAAKEIQGSAAISFEVLDEAAKEVVLDTRDLTIHEVLMGGKPLRFALGETSKAFGTPLTIHLPDEPRPKGSEVTLTITYRTSPTSSALAWMPPEQTNGGQHPYLFSQCQAIHARSLFPCQDTPGVRASYTATVCVPSNLQVLMSALMKSTEVKKDTRVTTFEQPIPIASYLVAIVSGNLEKRDISSRVAVWSEPDVVERAAHDFSDAEKFVAFGEELVGKYEWTRYDVVCLPGSFPYGGMENPCLTFVTPSLLTGDKSLADVICHEVAHSWTGNLVGPKTWEDFYLNEGFTMFLERKITTKVLGRPEYFDFSAILGWQHLKEDVERYGLSHPFTCLRPDLGGVDPDDAFSSVPYEKGFCLLYYIQTLVGNPKWFEQWLHEYIQHFRHKSITTDQMREHLLNYFSQPEHNVDLSAIDWKAWMDSPGMPPVIPGFKSVLMERVVEHSNQWLTGKGGSAGDMDDWLPLQKCCFLNTLLASSGKVDKAMLDRLDDLYKFNSSTNAEITFLWLRLCIRADWGKHMELLRGFLSRIGRMKFTRPLYRELKARDKKLAQELFLQNASRYHNICTKMVSADLELTYP